VSGGVLSILATLPGLQADIPGEVPIVLLTAGGFGYNAVFGVRFVWAIGNQNLWEGGKKIVAWLRDQKYGPAMYFLVLIFVVMIATVPLAGIFNIEVHFYVSLLFLLLTITLTSLGERHIGIYSMYSRPLCTMESAAHSQTDWPRSLEY
jgi:hypothetical protein